MSPGPENEGCTQKTGIFSLAGWRGPIDRRVTIGSAATSIRERASLPERWECTLRKQITLQESNPQKNSEQGLQIHSSRVSRARSLTQQLKNLTTHSEMRDKDG